MWIIELEILIPQFIPGAGMWSALFVGFLGCIGDRGGDVSAGGWA